MTANMGSNTVESTSSTELPRKSMSKASEHRRVCTSNLTDCHRIDSNHSFHLQITKPIMEKKRRARINNSLNELKVLILDALNKDPSRHSKLEKADILEMTVRHLQKLQRQQVAAAIVNDPSVLNKYRAGFSECASEVNRYLGNMEGFDQPLRQRILGHLNHCVNSLNQMASNAQFGMSSSPKTAFPGMVPPSNNSLHVQIPMHSSSSNLFGSNSFMVNSSDINNNTFLHPNLCSSPVDLKQSLSTPPSSASSTSSHFAFNLNMHSPSVTKSSMPISLTTSDLFYRKTYSSLSPGSSSFASEQLSPVGSDDMDMAVDCTMSRKDQENVWRPW